MKNKKKHTIKLSGYHFKKICREVLNDNAKFDNLLRAVSNNEMEMRMYDSPPTYSFPVSEYWTLPPSKEVELYEKPTKRTITIGYKKRSKDFIKKFVKKKKIDIYYATMIYLDEFGLKRYLNYIKKIIKLEEAFGRSRVIKNVNKIKLNPFFSTSKTDFRGSKPFIFYLKKSQIKFLENVRFNGFSGPNMLSFSVKQLLKTYKEVIKINSEIYRYIKYRKFDRFYKDNKPNTPSPPPPKPLALTDKPYKPKELLTLTENLEKDLTDLKDEKDLIDFGDAPIVIGDAPIVIGDEKDLIDFGEDEKDLIDFDTIIPPPPKKPTAQELLMDEELFPKGKKYKVLQDKDLIPTSTTPSTNGVNILKNILNYPETKRILGISLTSDLKQKIKNLDSEAAFGLANILSSLISANRGKMSVYSVSRNQLKEIIEGFITTLSVLLNPTQKY